MSEFTDLDALAALVDDPTLYAWQQILIDRAFVELANLRAQVQQPSEGVAPAGYEAVWAIRYRDKFRVFAYEEEAHRAAENSIVWKAVRIYVPIDEEK